MPDSPVLTMKEVAKYLRVAVPTITRMIKRGELTCGYKIGSDWRFNRESIDAWRKDRDGSGRIADD
jgi:excisionase family DNA binding protein